MESLLSSRIANFERLSKQLSELSYAKITALLRNAKPLHSGIGGNTALLFFENIPIFVKKVPLTDLERKELHIQSTRNLFELPLYYQYGIGSTGFGVWRELSAHQITTSWVLNNECPHFPLLYHSLFLETPKLPDMPPEERQRLENNIQYWGGSSSIKNRLHAIHEASASLIFFLEYVPCTLEKWLQNKLASSETEVNEAVAMLEKNLFLTTKHMRKYGFLHCDAHFKNILTDGSFLYFTDFGLALSSSYQLSEEEIIFLKDHKFYDHCNIIMALIYTIITHYCNKNKEGISYSSWLLYLHDYLIGKTPLLPSCLDIFIKNYAPIAQTMDTFYKNLRTKSKHTPYPKQLLEHLLTSIQEQ